MRALTVTVLLAALATGAAAQDRSGGGAQVPFGGFEHDSTLPVEITSDALALDQTAGTAIFTGTVKVAQGQLRLAADRLEVFYAEDAENAGDGGKDAGKDAGGKAAGGKAAAGKAAATKDPAGKNAGKPKPAGGRSQGGIERMIATGNVTLSNGAEAAEAKTASYVVATGIVEMEGDVLLTQGRNALAGQKMRVDLEAGAATMEGRVQTVIIPSDARNAAGNSGGNSGGAAAPARP